MPELNNADVLPTEALIRAAKRSGNHLLVKPEKLDHLARLEVAARMMAEALKRCDAPNDDARSAKTAALFYYEKA